MIKKNIFSNFIEKIIQNDIKEKNKKKLRFRFPPEPNGYLHIGHAKAICLNFGLSKIYKSPINLRFDDTNPHKEEKLFINSIKKDILWLGFNWDNEFYTSDYFNKLYYWSKNIIKKGKAYIDNQNQEDIIKQRKNPNEPGIESPYRNRSIKDNLILFKKMKSGEFEEGYCVLRAKINMNSPNMHLRDPIMYRIIKTPHYRTKNKWNIYPTYDWAHGQSDYIEQISHSLCSFEFDNHKPLYNWYLDQIYEENKIRPIQYEFSRLNLKYNIMSKRKLFYLVKKKIVSSWDDPRMPTISGLRRRGYTAKSIRNFCKTIGITKRKNVIEFSLLEFIIRNELKKSAPRIMVVLDPIEIIIENYPENKVEWLSAINNPENIKIGTRSIPFSKTIYIEKKDFMEKASKDFFRLSIGNKVRLKNSYIIKGVSVLKDKNNKIIKVYAKYYSNSLSGSNTKENLRKIKSTLHWVSSKHYINVELRLYDKLFLDSLPEKYNEKDFKNILNPNSLKIISAYSEKYIKKSCEGDRFQFQRIGYFCVDKDSSEKKIIFNKIVNLKN